MSHRRNSGIKEIFIVLKIPQDCVNACFVIVDFLEVETMKL